MFEKIGNLEAPRSVPLRFLQLARRGVTRFSVGDISKRYVARQGGEGGELKRGSRHAYVARSNEIVRTHPSFSKAQSWHGVSEMTALWLESDAAHQVGEAGVLRDIPANEKGACE